MAAGHSGARRRTVSRCRGVSVSRPPGSPTPAASRAPVVLADGSPASRPVGLRSTGVTLRRGGATRVSIDPGTPPQRPRINRVAALVDHPVTGSAQGDEVVGIVRATVFARHDVVHVQEMRAPAPGGATPMTVTCEHLSPHRRRDGRAVSLTLSVYARIAERGLQRPGRDGHRPPPRRDLSSTAGLTLANDDLVAGRG